jgi:hypothetical protein
MSDRPVQRKKAPRLADFITFTCEPQSWITDDKAEKLDREIAAAVGIEENPKDAKQKKLRAMLNTFSIVYACTTAVELHNEARVDASLRTLYDLWQRRDELTLVELWNMRLQQPYTLWNEWFSQWDGKQRLFELDPAEIPDDMLTSQQKAELKDPRSPLASDAEPSGVG